jgi:hypothetical protein
LLQKCGYSAATLGFDNNVAIRQLLAHTHRAAFRMVPVPSMVPMPPSAIMVPITNDDIVTVTGDNLRRRRDSGHKRRADGRT